jgi:hypothetical protein
MNASHQAIATAPPPLLRTHAASTNDVPLTRVSLAFVERRINLYLRFGQPAHAIQLDQWRRCAVFLPAAVFCRIRWESNDYGTIRWQLLVLRACTPIDAMQRIPGIRPGAGVLLHAEGERKVKAVLQQIDAIEALSIDPADVSPVYWRTLGNRLSAHSPLPAYTTERHAAWLVGRALQ